MANDDEETTVPKLAEKLGRMCTEATPDNHGFFLLVFSERRAELCIHADPNLNTDIGIHLASAIAKLYRGDGFKTHAVPMDDDQPDGVK